MPWPRHTPHPVPLAATLAALLTLALAPAQAQALEPHRSTPDPRDVESALAPATTPYTPIPSFYVASKAHLATTFRLLQATLHPEHAAPAADDPRPAFLSRRQLRQVLSRLTPTVLRCLHAVGRKDATVTLRLRVEGATGRVSRAAVIGAFARSPVHRCVTTVARRLRFPRFRQPSQWIVYPVIVRARSANSRPQSPNPSVVPSR